MGLSVADALAGGGACTNSVSQLQTGGRRVGRYFLARLPLEGRSEGGAPVGVLFS